MRDGVGAMQADNNPLGHDRAMFALAEHFTENPWPVLLLLAFVELVLIIIMKVKGQGVWLKLAFGVPVLALVLLVVELLIVTDREAVKADVRAMAEAVRVEDADAILSHICRDYDDGRFTYESLRTNVASLLDMVELESVWLFYDEVRRLRDGRMVARFRAVTTGRASGVPYSSHPSRWQVYYQQCGGQWKVCQIEPLEAQGTEAWRYVRNLIYGR